MATAYQFTIALAGEWDEVTDEMADRLYEAGCDDATVVMRGGRISLAFVRLADNGTDAMLSAVRDVRKAGFEID